MFFLFETNVDTIPGELVPKKAMQYKLFIPEPHNWPGWKILLRWWSKSLNTPINKQRIPKWERTHSRHHGTHGSDKDEPKLWLWTIMELVKATDPVKNTTSPPGIFCVFNFSVLFMENLETTFKAMPGNTIIARLDVKINCIKRGTVIWHVIISLKSHSS